MKRVARQKIERYVVVLNPYSTNGKKGEKYVSKLRDAQPDAEIAVVRAASAAKIHPALLAALQKGEGKRQLIIVAGGDGTVHLVVNALMHPDTPAALRQIPLTAWALGNGNDFFNSIHTKDAEREPLHVVQSPKAHTVRVRPLEWTIQPEKGNLQQRFALCYSTIGATGQATAAITSTEHRKRRQTINPRARTAHDIVSGAPALLLPKPFDVQIGTVRRRLVEMQFINGPVMTIHARYNTRLSDKNLFFGTVEQGNPVNILVTAARTIAGNPPGRTTTRPITFRLLQPAHAQLDGEYLELPAGTITVAPSKTALTIWATKPA